MSTTTFLWLMCPACHPKDGSHITFADSVTDQQITLGDSFLLPEHRHFAKTMSRAVPITCNNRIGRAVQIKRPKGEMRRDLKFWGIPA